jgi:hypothetical protein
MWDRSEGRKVTKDPPKKKNEALSLSLSSRLLRLSKSPGLSNFPSHKPINF